MTETARILTPDDAPALREMRLKSLRHYGPMFDAFHAAEAAKPEDYWRDLATEKLDHCWFGLFDGMKLVGLCGARLWEEDPTDGSLLAYGAYVLPEYRGQGRVRPLYRCRAQWAAECGYHHLVGFLQDGNAVTKGIWERNGAEYLFSRPMGFSGGPETLFHWYRMALRPAQRAPLLWAEAARVA